MLRDSVLFDMGRAMSRTNALDLWEWQASLPPYPRVRLRGTLKPFPGLSSFSLTYRDLFSRPASVSLCCVDKVKFWVAELYVWPPSEHAQAT